VVVEIKGQRKNMPVNKELWSVKAALQFPYVKMIFFFFKKEGRCYYVCSITWDQESLLLPDLQ